MGFLIVPNLVPWIIFIASIVNDQFCWITLHLHLDREGIKRRSDGERSGGEAIVSNISVQGRRLIDGRLLFEEIRYNLSVLGTYFECEGVKCTYFNFTRCPRKVRSSEKSKFAAKYGLHHTWENTWPIINGRYLKAICMMCTCSSPEILMNRHKHPCLG